VSELKFPVLVYTPHYLMGSISNKNKLHIVSEKKLAGGCFDNGVVVDSSGARYRIISVNKKELHSLTLLHVLKAIVGWDSWNSKPVWAELELSLTGKLNLEGIKSEILGVLKKNKKWYLKYDYTEHSISTLVNDARTVKDLINRISIYP
jgi:hypothetical protein